MPVAFAAVVYIERSIVIMAIVIVTLRGHLAGPEGLRGMKVDHNKLQREFCLSLCSLCILLAGVFAIASVVARSTG